MCGVVQSDIDARFRDFPDGMRVEDFVAITKDLCGFPSFFNAPFFRRILASSSSSSPTTPPTSTSLTEPQPTADDADAPRITREVFQAYWSTELAPFDSVERFFRVVRAAIGVVVLCGTGRSCVSLTLRSLLSRLVSSGLGTQVKQPQNDFIERDDFAPFLHGTCVSLAQ